MNYERIVRKAKWQFNTKPMIKKLLLRVGRVLVNTVKSEWDYGWHQVAAIVLVIFGAAFGIFAGIILLMQWSLGESGIRLSFLGWSTLPFLLTALVVRYLPALVEAILVERAAVRKEAESARKQMVSSSPGHVVTAYLRNQIDSLRDELVGEKSPWERLHREVQETRDAAIRLRGQLRERMYHNKAEYLEVAFAQLNEVVSRTGLTLEELNGFKDKVDVFLLECAASIGPIESTLSDLELARQAGVLAGQAGAHQTDAERLIANGATELFDRMLGVRSDALERFKTHGLALPDLLAVNPEPPREHDAFRALGELEVRLSTFDPRRAAQRQ